MYLHIRQCYTFAFNYLIIIFKTHKENNILLYLPIYLSTPLLFFIPYIPDFFLLLFPFCWSNFLQNSFSSGLLTTNSVIILFVWKCLYFTFILERYFCWIYNSGLIVLFFKELSIFWHFPLTSVVSDENFTVIWMMLFEICCFSLCLLGFFPSS